MDSTTRFEKLEKIGRTIGNTDLIEISTPPDSARIFAKLEYQNPFGTIKDRVAFAMVKRIFDNDPTFCRPILEYTGGSLGVSLASICSELELPLIIVASHISPQLKSVEDRQLCQIVRVDPSFGFWNVMERAREIAKSNPHLEFLYQHQNPANLQTHKDQTGVEIIEQLTKMNISTCDAWVASIGTGGSLVGVFERLRLKFPEVQLVAVSPSELPYGSTEPPNGKPKFAGSGGLGCGRKQPFVESIDHLISRHMKFTFEETNIEVKRFFDDTGIKIGTSAAANLLAARETAHQLGSGKTVVTLFPSA